MIEVQRLTKTYGQIVAVNQVSFAVNEGETLVLLGTSGSGKTTTLRMINRLMEPTAGNIIINGNNVLAQPPEVLRRSIGYVLQGYGLFPHYTVAENIAIVPKLLKWKDAQINERTDELLHKLQLPPGQYRHVYPSGLSGGQMQRVGLARALAANPPILLMDEPFGALDPLTRIAVRREFKALDELKKKTIILVTHDVQEAVELGTVIGLMDKGTMQQLATPSEMLFRPANHFVQQFFNHQRLQLELQSSTIKTIWSKLPGASAVSTATLYSHQNLWDAMEAITNSRAPVVAYDKETNTFKCIDFTQLQAAIQNQQSA